MLSVGMIIGGAFRLLRERPGSVVIWGAIYSLCAFALGYFMISTMAPMQAMGEHPNPNQALAAMGSLFGKLVLLELVFFCVYAVLLTAAQRAVLRPEESALASIRFSGDELRMIGLAIFLGFLFFIGYLAAAVVLGLVLAAAGAAGGGIGAMGPVAIVGGLIILCLVLFFWVRVSLAFPLTLMRGRFVLGEAWRLSRGHFWRLLGGYIVLMLIVILLVLVSSLVLQGGYWSRLMAGGISGPGAQQAAQTQMEAQYSLGLPMILTLVAGAVIGGLTIAFTGGAVATAARALASDQQEVAETFA
jgi:hypothetical protein